jgi:hypothetical protein
MLSDRSKSILLQVALKEASPISVALGGTQKEIVERLESLTVDIFNTIVGLHDKLGLKDTDPPKRSYNKSGDRTEKVENAALKDAPRVVIGGVEFFDYRGIKQIPGAVSPNWPDFKRTVETGDRKLDSQWLLYKGNATDFAKENGLA